MPNINDVLLEINNFFEKTKEYGSFEITTNKILGIDDLHYQAGQYVRLYNSILNNGVYKITATEDGEITLDATLQPETANNLVVFGLAIPSELISLAAEIESKGSEQNVLSKTVSRYSVSFGEKGGAWTNVYKDSLNKWRKIGWS